MNPMIAMGVRSPQFVEPEPQSNTMMRVLQIKGAMDEQQLRGMQRDKLRKDMDDEKALSEVYAGALGPDGALDRNKLLTGLAGRGLGTKIPTVQKTFADADKAKSDAIKAASENYKTFQTELASEFNNPNLTKDAVAQRIALRVQAGALDPAIGQKVLATLPDDPTQLRGSLRQILTSQMTPEQMLTAFAPKPEKMDNGQQITFRDTNPNSPTYGQNTAGGVVQKVVTPDAVLQANTSTENNKRSVGAQYAIAAAVREQATATRDAARIQSQFKTEQGLREEFAGLPEVKRYKAAYPSYAAIVKAAQTNNPQADINLVYGLAKLYDPESVVREGEYATIANSQAIPEWIKGMAQRLAGGGRLTAETKRQVLEQAQGRILTFQAEFDKARGTYEQIGRGQGLDPNRLFTPVGEPVTPTVDFNSLPGGGKPQGAGKPRELQWGK